MHRHPASRLLWCLVGATCGIALALAVAGPPLSPILLASLVTRTVHPPAGANPILMVYVHAGWAAFWQPALPGVGALVLVAIVWSRLYPGLARYPVAPWEPSPPHLTWGGWGNRSRGGWSLGQEARSAGQHAAPGRLG